MRKRVLKSSFAIIMAIVISTSMVAPVCAASGTKTIKVNAYGDGYTYTSGQKRSKKYSYCYACCNWVEPVKSSKRKDDFHYIRVKIFKNDNGKKKPISKEKVLQEGNGYEKVRLDDNQMNVNYAYFGFIGNSPNHAARTSVSYNAN